MDPSELRTQWTLINHAIKEYNFEREPLRPIEKYQLPQNLIIKVNSTSHHRELIILQYSMYITIGYKYLGSTVCKLLMN